MDADALVKYENRVENRGLVRLSARDLFDDATIDFWRVNCDCSGGGFGCCAV